MQRRHLIAAGAGLATPAFALAHTPYGQWSAYRAKHLLVGCHRADPRTYTLAKQLVAHLDEALPAAAARVARGRTPMRLASLLTTGQLHLALVSEADARAIAAGAGAYRRVGPVALTQVAAFADRCLCASAAFPARHGWLLARAMDRSPDAGACASPGLPTHRGAAAWRAGEPQPP